MNYLIEDGKVRGKLKRIPSGLPELLSDISREVMRCAPPKDCLLEFITDYVSSLIVGEEKLVAADRVINRCFRPVGELIPQICLCQMNTENQTKICKVMEDCFKEYLETSKPTFPSKLAFGDFRPYEMVDTLLARCKLSDADIKKSRGIVDANFDRFVAMYIESHANDEPPDRLSAYLIERAEYQVLYERYNQAAVTIQSSFRGFLVRRCVYLKYLRMTEAEMEWAAFKIQRYYRKYRMAAEEKERRKYRNLSDMDIPTEASNVCGIYSLVDMDPKIDYDYILLRRRRRLMMEDKEEYSRIEHQINILRGRISEELPPVEEEQPQQVEDGEEKPQVEELKGEEEVKPEEEPAEVPAAEVPAAVATRPEMAIESDDTEVDKKKQSDDEVEVTSSFTGDYEDEMEGEFGSIEGSDDF